jgi:hypothetical protein
MDFTDALKSVQQGQKITRQTWENRAVYVSLQAGFLMIMLDDKMYHQLLVSETDLYARDWITVAEG